MKKKIFDLTGKVAIVTGGGSGIGLAICRRFTEMGARAYMLDVSSETLQSASEELSGDKLKINTILCDVSSGTQVKEAIDKLGTDRIDILINNAGVAHIGNVEQTSEEDLDRVYSINVKGVYNCLRAVIPLMKKSGGVILNLASIASVVGLADRFAYSMSKGAVLTMTYSVARDYINYGIRCNCIAPARVHTPFVDGFLASNYPGQEAEMYEKLSQTQPIGRMGKPEEIADLALYLCSDEASFITGSCYPIDGGFITLNS